MFPYWEKEKRKDYNFSLEKAKFFIQSFEARGSARQTALELYKVFSKYIFWSGMLAEDMHKIRKS